MTLDDAVRKTKLLAVLESYTTESLQLSFVYKMRNDNNVTPKDCVMALADGLMYGNWPWTNYSNLNIEIKAYPSRFHNAINRWNKGEAYSVSTGIDGVETYGYGSLDDNGFWEFMLPGSAIITLRQVENKRRHESRMK